MPYKFPTWHEARRCDPDATLEVPHNPEIPTMNGTPRNKLGFDDGEQKEFVKALRQPLMVQTPLQVCSAIVKHAEPLLSDDRLFGGICCSCSMM